MISAPLLILVFVLSLGLLGSEGAVSSKGSFKQGVHLIWGMGTTLLAEERMWFLRVRWNATMLALS